MVSWGSEGDYKYVYSFQQTFTNYLKALPGKDSPNPNTIIPVITGREVVTLKDVILPRCVNSSRVLCTPARFQTSEILNTFMCWIPQVLTPGISYCWWTAQLETSAYTKKRPEHHCSSRCSCCRTLTEEKSPHDTEQYLIHNTRLPSMSWHLGFEKMLQNGRGWMWNAVYR